MKSFALLRSIRLRATHREITGPLQSRYFQPDFVPADPKAKPKKYKLPPSYDPYGPRPPPSEKIIQLAEKIAALPPEERMQIGPTLRERLRHPKMQSISVDGVDLGAQGGSVAGAAKAEEKAEKTAFDIKLEKFDASAKIKVIKEVRAFTNLGLKEAKDMVEKVPVVIKQGVSKDDAKEIIEKIKAAGGRNTKEEKKGWLGGFRALEKPIPSSLKTPLLISEIKKMSGQLPPRRTNSMSSRRSNSSNRKSVSAQSENGTNGNPSKPPSSGERTVKNLRLSKALTIPEGTTVSDACKRMAARRVDAVLLTDANALLSGIVTDKDIATRVLAEELRPDQTIISKVMTRNPTFVSSDSLAIDALQKMVQGKFRHLPVVENGEVIALLDITKCLYDAISRMEKAAEQGSAIAAAVEGVERQWGNNFSAPSAFIETLRDRMFKPSLSTIIAETSKVATVVASDPVSVAAKRMQEMRVNSVIIMAGNNIQGILTSKDLLMRVVAQNLPPELTLVEKVMTPNPEYATVDTTILEALHIMHDGKFLHLPVVDKDGNVVACVDVLQITHAAISMAESNSGADMANTVMQKFWDSALNLDPPDDYDDSQSEMSMSAIMTSDGADGGRSYPSLGLGNSFAFKFEDLRGRVHRFTFGTENLTELVSAVTHRMGGNIDHSPQLLYDDDEGDRVLLTTDSDLVGAVNHARSAGQKVLRLHLDNSEFSQRKRESQLGTVMEERTIENPKSSHVQTGILASAAVIAGIACVVYLKRSNQ